MVGPGREQAQWRDRRADDGAVASSATDAVRATAGAGEVGGRGGRARQRGGHRARSPELGGVGGAKERRRLIPSSGTAAAAKREK